MTTTGASQPKIPSVISFTNTQSGQPLKPTAQKKNPIKSLLSFVNRLKPLAVKKNKNASSLSRANNANQASDLRSASILSTPKSGELFSSISFSLEKNQHSDTQSQTSLSYSEPSKTDYTSHTSEASQETISLISAGPSFAASEENFNQGIAAAGSNDSDSDSISLISYASTLTNSIGAPEPLGPNPFGVAHLFGGDSTASSNPQEGI